MDLPSSLALLFAAVALFAFCRWRDTRPIEIGQVRYVPYGPVMILCLVVILFVSAHVLSLLLGKPLPGTGL